MRRGEWNGWRQDGGRWESGIRRSFRTLHASYDGRVVGEGHEVWLVRAVLGGRSQSGIDWVREEEMRV